MNAKTLTTAVATIFLIACSAESTTAGSSNQDAQEGKATSPKGESSSSSGESKTPSGTEGNSSAGAAKPIAGCDAEPPTLPQTNASFVVGSTPPVAKGGDEKGLWIATKVTAYLPKSASVLVDVEASSADGVGFVQFDGQRFLTFSDITTSLATRVSGKVVSSSKTTMAGTYKYADGQLTVTPECVKSTAEDNGKQPSLGFSRISDTEALFLNTGDSQIGEVTIAMTLQKKDQ